MFSEDFDPYFIRDESFSDEFILKLLNVICN